VFCSVCFVCEGTAKKNTPEALFAANQRLPGSDSGGRPYRKHAGVDTLWGRHYDYGGRHVGWQCTRGKVNVLHLDDIRFHDLDIIIADMIKLVRVENAAGIGSKDTVHYVGPVKLGWLCFEHFQRISVGDVRVLRLVRVPRKSLFMSDRFHDLMHNMKVTLTDDDAGVGASLQGADNGFAAFPRQPISLSVADPLGKNVKQSGICYRRMDIS